MTRRPSSPSGRRSGSASARGRSATTTCAAPTRTTSPRCCPTRRASRTWGTSRTTPSATPSRTSSGAWAGACCTRSATTRSGCRPRTTRSAAASTRASRPRASIAAFQREFRSWGVSFDWSRELATHEPRYYRWTQWIFLKLYERGLAYRSRAAVNWCPKDQTVLANEQVIDGRCERCGTPVEARQLEQWFFRITDYADRLLDDLDDGRVAVARGAHAANWIGRSEGAEVTFTRARDGRRLPGLHHPPGHAVRRDVLRHGARAPRRAAARPRAPSTRRPSATTSTTR